MFFFSYFISQKPILKFLEPLACMSWVNGIASIVTGIVLIGDMILNLENGFFIINKKMGLGLGNIIQMSYEESEYRISPTPKWHGGGGGGHLTFLKIVKKIYWKNDIDEDSFKKMMNFYLPSLFNCLSNYYCK